MQACENGFATKSALQSRAQLSFCVKSDSVDRHHFYTLYTSVEARPSDIASWPNCQFPLPSPM